MPVIQAPLYIPNDTARAIIEGTLYRTGGTIRHTATGRIHSHLKDATTKQTAEMVLRAARNNPTAAAGIGIGSAAAVLGAALLAKRTASSNRTTQRLETALTNYLNAARSGELTVVIIDAAIESLDTEEAVTLPDLSKTIPVIADHTATLLALNAAALVGTDLAVDTSDTIAALRHNLTVQRDILCLAA